MRSVKRMKERRPPVCLSEWQSHVGSWGVLQRLDREDANIFDAYGIEREISKIFRSRIYLDSGGFIVIQQTEALVSIDVNTGSFVGNKSLENTVTITNIEAAKEIARQIRLQDLTGMIFIDFIDMYKPENRLKVLQTFRQEMAKDYCPNKIFSLNFKRL